MLEKNLLSGKSAEAFTESVEFVVGFASLLYNGFPVEIFIERVTVSVFRFKMLCGSLKRFAFIAFFSS